MKDQSIGLFLLTRQNDYQRLQEKDAVTTAHRLKVPLEVHFAENDAYVQAQQIFAFVHSHPAGSALVVEPVGDSALKPAIRHAALAGMSWFLLHRSVAFVSELRREFPATLMSLVAADQKEIGRVQGKQFDMMLGGSGSILYVHGPAASSAATERFAGMKEIIDRTSIKYQMVYGDWTEESGEKAVSSWLFGPGANVSLRLVACQNDAMAVGALRALSRGAAMLGRADLARLEVTGVDGLADHGLQLVDRKRLAATIVMPPVAGRAIELIHQAWTTAGFVPPAVVLAPVRSYPDITRLSVRVPL